MMRSIDTGGSSPHNGNNNDKKDDSSNKDSNISKSFHSTQSDDNMAVLYSQWPVGSITGCQRPHQQQSVCQHVIPWSEWLEGLSTQCGNIKCPKCNDAKITLVCDSHANQQLLPILTKELSNPNHDLMIIPSIQQHQSQFVCFKYGKQVYILSTIIPRSPPLSTTQHRSTSLSSLSSWWFWSTSCSLFSSSKPSNSLTRTASSQQDDDTVTLLAQDRIVQALQLSTIKILHKSKVLYTMNNIHNNINTTQAQQQQQQQISQTLLETSFQDLTAITKTMYMMSSIDASTSNKTKTTTEKKTTTTKVSLLVMGTTNETWQKHHSINSHYHPNYSNYNHEKVSWSVLLSWPWKMGRVVATLTWWMIVSVLQPFLPSQLIGNRHHHHHSTRNNDLHYDNDDNNNDEDENDDTPNNVHAHQE